MGYMAAFEYDEESPEKGTIIVCAKSIYTRFIRAYWPYSCAMPTLFSLMPEESEIDRSPLGPPDTGPSLAWKQANATFIDDLFRRAAEQGLDQVQALAPDQILFVCDPDVQTRDYICELFHRKTGASVIPMAFDGLLPAIGRTLGVMEAATLPAALMSADQNMPF